MTIGNVAYVWGHINVIDYFKNIFKNSKHYQEVF